MICVGNVGTKFLLRIFSSPGVRADVSTATTKEIHFLKPNGTTLTKTASFETDGSDGEIYYISATNDLDGAGFWWRQGYIESPTWTGHTSKLKFEVISNLVSS